MAYNNLLCAAILLKTGNGEFIAVQILSSTARNLKIFFNC